METIRLEKERDLELEKTLARIRVATEAAQEKIDALRIDGLIRHVTEAYRELGRAEGKGYFDVSDDILLRKAIICAAELRSAVMLKR